VTIAVLPALPGIDAALPAVGIRLLGRTEALVWPALFVAALTWHRLAAAYAHYLGFDHPRATASASQVIVFLVALIAIVYL
jgi:hypothetical protein